MFLLEIGNALIKVNLDVPNTLVVDPVWTVFCKRWWRWPPKCHFHGSSSITMVLKVVLAVVILTRLLLKLAAVVFGTVDEETVGYVMLLVIYIPLNMHSIGE